MRRARLKGRFKRCFKRTQTVEEKKKAQLEEIWNEFLETTSFDGLRNIFLARNGKQRLFWAILFMTATVISLHLSIRTIQVYNESPSTITVYTSYWKKSMRIPHVAICYLGGPNVTLLKEANISDNLSTLLIRQFTSRIKGKDVMLLNEEELLELEKELNALLFRLEINFAQLMRRISFQCESLISYSNQADVCSDSKVMLHPFIGSCVVLRTFEQLIPGIEAGVHVSLISPDKKDTFAGSNSIILFNAFGLELGDPYNHPNLATLSASASGALQLALGKTIYSRSPEGKSSCSNNGILTSMAGCYFICRNTVTAKHCGCVEAKYVETSKENEVHVCTPIAMYRCEKEFAHQNEGASLHDEAIRCQQNCPPPCDESRIRPTVSYMKLENRLTNSSKRPKLHISVGFPTFNVELVEEKSSFTIDMVIGSIGGQAGLWLGCSVMSFFHLLYYLMRLCLHSRSRRKLRQTMSVRRVPFSDLLQFNIK